VWLRSSEANIQLSGEFRVSKSVEDGLPRYRLDGTLAANRGTYRLNLQAASKDFRVVRGAVRFYGSPDFNPELDIAAEHTLRTAVGGQLVVRAIIGGTLLAPRLTLESDQRPPLTETEVISYLLFGRPSFELGGGPGPSSEQRLLAGAVTSLAGVSAGLLEQSLVTDLGLPIDYLTIRPGAGASNSDVLSGARVEAGTQLSSRTFLTLNAGLCEVRQGQASQLLGFSLEYRLSRMWTFEASYEPIVRQCRADVQRQFYGSYQLGFDLFWQSGIR
jgi:translocation and assembly module TamB